MKPTTSKNIWIAAGYAGVLILGMLIGPKFARENVSSKSGSFLSFSMDGRYEKVDKVIQIINDHYVDSVKTDTIEELAIEEVLKHLDPHSKYLKPTEASLLSEDLEGNFDGIGIEYFLLNDTLLVTAVTPNGPAYKAGLLHGDKIIKINNSSSAGAKLANKQVVEAIRGKKGTTVDLLIKRDDQLKNVKVIRDQINISSIDAAYLLNNEAGYIKISKFGANTDRDFAESLKKLKQAGMKNLVLDLRENGGGYLNSATALADEFLGYKQLIVYTEGLHEPRTNYYATEEGGFENGKLVVLIDENSASASEIVAGAVQDLDRGTIIGRRSFGKGLVQEPFSFGDGSVLNLTISRYYTPSGRSIQKSYKNGIDAYYDEVGSRYKNGELSSDGRSLNDTLYNKQKTYTTKSGKVLYGGGGIMPDIYIPIDTSGYTTYYRNINRTEILNDFLFNYLVKRIHFSDLNNLIKNFKLSDEDFRIFVKIASAKGIKPSALQLELSRKEIQKDLKAVLARYSFGDEGFYRVLNAEDRAITRSLEVFK